ncbi:MAG: zonular occludens toxin domain-containing protein [Rhodanobacter sp.]
MPVKLFTGLPGAGKTARLVAEIVKLRKASPDRPIYQRGINGLVDGLALPISDDELHNWRDALAPGAIICIDECQEDGLMPLDKGQPAKWVRDISKVRHEGMDFLLTTQHPTLMSAYVRKLVDQHVHCVRKFNTQIVSWYTWGRCMETPEKGSTQKAATASAGMLPKEVFDLYKSASLHTMKPRIPPKVYVLAACAVLFVSAVVAVPIVLQHMRLKAQAIAGTPVPGASASIDSSLRTKDYVAWVRPRVEGLPWTAPAYDGRQAKSDPRVYCIAVDDGRCSCLSEQGTRIVMDVKVCRAIAANGVYNPFAEPLQDQPAQERRSGVPAAQTAQRAKPETDAPTLPPSGRFRAGVPPTTYTPPQLMPPNA